MRYRSMLLVLAVLAGCSKGKSTEELIDEDVKARGLIKPPPQAAPAPAATEFKAYNSPKGTFRINFPGDPRFVDHGPSMPDHRTGMESYVILREPRQYSVLNSHLEEAPDPAKELQRLSDYLLSRTLEGKLVDSKEVTVKGKPGREIVLVDDDRARRARLIVDGKDVYQVSVDLPADEVDGEAAKAFVRSFGLLKD